MTFGGESSPTPISPSDRAQIYEALHRDFLDRFNTTRRIEWIVNGGLWTAIILAGPCPSGWHA